MPIFPLLSFSPRRVENGGAEAEHGGQLLYDDNLTSSRVSSLGCVGAPHFSARVAHNPALLRTSLVYPVISDSACQQDGRRGKREGELSRLAARRFKYKHNFL